MLKKDKVQGYVQYIKKKLNNVVFTIYLMNDAYKFVNNPKV